MSTARGGGWGAHDGPPVRVKCPGLRFPAHQRAGCPKTWRWRPGLGRLEPARPAQAKPLQRAAPGGTAGRGASGWTGAGGRVATPVHAVLFPPRGPTQGPSHRPPSRPPVTRQQDRGDVVPTFLTVPCAPGPPTSQPCPLVLSRRGHAASQALAATLRTGWPSPPPGSSVELWPRPPGIRGSDLRNPGKHDGRARVCRRAPRPQGTGWVSRAGTGVPLWSGQIHALGVGRRLRHVNVT